MVIWVAWSNSLKRTGISITLRYKRNNTHGLECVILLVTQQFANNYNAKNLWTNDRILKNSAVWSKTRFSVIMCTQAIETLIMKSRQWTLSSRRCCYRCKLHWPVRVFLSFRDGGGQRVCGQPAEPGARWPGHLRHRWRQRRGKWARTRVRCFVFLKWFRSDCSEFYPLG